MNPIIKTLILFSFVVLLVACKINKPIVTTIPENNQTYQVDYLFEHEGCKVYRFWDRGNYVYFTNCTGDVTSLKTDSTNARVVNKVRVQPQK